MNPESAPAGNAFAVAVQWFEGTFLGAVATGVAVIAVASIGYLLLSGRVDVRRAIQVILGCFIIFGASSIAAGIMRGVAESGRSPPARAASLPPRPYPSDASEPAVKRMPYDPYAGAAMPVRR